MPHRARVDLTADTPGEHVSNLIFTSGNGWLIWYMFAGRAIESIDGAAVGQLLDFHYTSRVCLTGPVQPERQVSDLPHANIVGLGSFFELQGAHTLVVQLRKRLLSLQNAFVHHPEFRRSLQLLRLVAAPGLRKVPVSFVTNALVCLHIMMGCILQGAPC